MKWPAATWSLQFEVRDRNLKPNWEFLRRLGRPVRKLSRSRDNAWVVAFPLESFRRLDYSHLFVQKAEAQVELLRGGFTVYGTALTVPSLMVNEHVIDPQGEPSQVPVAFRQPFADPEVTTAARAETVPPMTADPTSLTARLMGSPLHPPPVAGTPLAG